MLCAASSNDNAASTGWSSHSWMSLLFFFPRHHTSTLNCRVNVFGQGIQVFLSPNLIVRAWSTAWDMFFTVHLTEHLTRFILAINWKSSVPQCGRLLRYVGSGAGLFSCAVTVDSTQAEWVYFCCRTYFTGIFKEMWHGTIPTNTRLHQRRGPNEATSEYASGNSSATATQVHHFINVFHQMQLLWYMNQWVSGGGGEEVCNRWMNAAACCVYTASNPTTASFIQKTISISLQHIFSLSLCQLFYLS